MAKLQDKFFNRIIEGPLEMDLSDKVVALEVSNVKSLSSEQCENLKCGDIVVKKDASGEHAYKVTFKSDTGMCLTYHDASVIETQSYDKVGQNWVYNGEDKTPNLLDVAEKSDIKPVYCHPVSIRKDTINLAVTMLIFTNDANPFTLTTFKNWVDSLVVSVGDNLRVMTSGSFKSSNKIVIGCYFYKLTNGYYGLSGQCADGTGFESLASLTFADIFPSDCIFTDGVNKIN